ncbi:mucin-5AC isoform X2 [Drosophila obscura]|uniref:mucin-5AC isoform X2 n=1 Tax=Drosophila obscura TaxID=7282 RepID=UPI001BB20F0B|nr:mucin-5AC isoform X2 [Drosophila obscura]
MRRKPQNLTESKQSSSRDEDADADGDEGGGTVHRGGTFSASAFSNDPNNRMPRDHRHMMAMWLALLLLFVQTTVAQHESISQISPKSSSQRNDRLSIESTIADSINGLAESQSTLQDDNDNDNENETRAERVERSASPILHDQHNAGYGAKAGVGPNDVHFPQDQEKDVSAGRYFHYNIKPTGTYDSQEEQPEQTQRIRAGKTLSGSSSSSSSSLEQSFLGKGGLRPLTSGSPIRPSPSSTVTSPTAAGASATQAPHSPRQNGNPDIQDIITGIVKLLNGNVNVHANTQGVVRRPSASRINNRGPPRISETQNLPPIDYEAQKPGTSMRPPPYPFDRPERPFITGVPIPEQIVPLRPGFVSNRPPWYRNKPRPPITTSVGGSRRPLPQYKPLPGPQVVPQAPPPQEQQEQHHQQQQQQQEQSLQPQDDSVLPTDTTYDSEFSNEDANAQYIEVSDQDTDATGGGEIDDELLQPPPAAPSTPNPPTSTPTAPKKKHKPKPVVSEKKKVSQEELELPLDGGGGYTTIVETSSVVNTVMGGMASTYVPMPMDSSEGLELDPSTEEVIFMTASRTPGLETSATSAISTSAISTSGITTATPSLSIEPSSSKEPTTTTTSTTTTSSTTPSTTSTSTTTTTTTTTTEKAPSSNSNSNSNTNATPPAPYHPRPGIVLDDPEFKPGGRPRPAGSQRPVVPPAPAQPNPPIQPTRQHLPPGYGEIFDVTLSAIQGPGPKGSGSKQTINIKPYGSYGAGGQGGQRQDDIIVSASGDEGFVSIDGKRTYINLFGDPTDPPAGATTPATRLPQLPGAGTSSGGGIVGLGGGGSGSASSAAAPPANAVTQSSGGYVVPETEVVDLQGQSQSTGTAAGAATTNAGPTRPHYRQRPTSPPVRIDTCIVGDDSTCDQAQHERCKTDSGVSSCHCRPGYSRRKHREPCRRVISFHLGLRVDRIYEHRIVWDHKLMDRHSEPFGQLSYESIRALDSAMSMTPYSDEFMEAKVNNIYRGDPNLGGNGVYVNMTLKLDESVETLRPNLRSDVQKHLLGVLHRRNNNIGNSVLYVSSPEGAVSPLQDLDECQSPDLNDCHPGATCSNTWGSFRCACEAGLRDPWADQPQRAGRECQACLDSFCNNHGTCSYNDEGSQICTCDSSHYGAQCEIDGEVLGVAIGASVAAIIIIVLTLVCLIMWSRRWQREQKNAMGSPVFGYMNTAPLKSAGLPQAGYQVTLEDRMRWAQIADVMAQTNHYGAEPIGPTRPSSAMFAYPNLGAMGMGMGTIGGMSLQSTMQMHPSATLAPPVPLPRLGLGPRSNGMRTLENSSSSEEEDRADLLGRNFQVPRPKSRSNGSIANQSGIYYDVDYEPSGHGIGNSSVDHLYGSQNQSVTHSSGNNHMPGPQGIPMSTYTSGRAPSSYYMK